MNWPGCASRHSGAGLTNVVGDAEIAEELATAPPRDAALRLRDHVLARGAPDNVTIVIVHAEPTS